MSIKEYFKKQKNSKKGFTMVEMVASICVLAIVSTVTVQALFVVRDTFRHTSEITANQYSTTQIEKFIRNELQVGSHIDVDSIPSTAYETNGVLLDEIMYYDESEEKLYFKKSEGNGQPYNDYLVLDSVNSVKFTVKPLKAEEDSKLKFEYVIDTEDYQYSGGIVMGNTAFKIGGGDDFPRGMGASDEVIVEWTESSPDNSKALIFHSEVMTPTSASSSGP